MFGKRKNKKVYCSDCRYYSHSDVSGKEQCRAQSNGIFVRSTYFSKEFVTRQGPSEKNKNNDCKDFEPAGPFGWELSKNCRIL